MSRYLLLDIGAGTLDILYWDEAADHHYKAVVKSPVRTLAEKVRKTPGDLLVVGAEMGGGPVSAALRKRAETNRVVLSVSAAATIHHTLERVQSHGFVVVGDDEAESLRREGRLAVIELGDLEIDRIRRIVEAFGVPFAVDAIGVCAQDHGAAPDGVSHLDFRHALFRERVAADPRPQALIHPGDAVPEVFNRLGWIARQAARMPAQEIFVMDSGMAAVAGASLDPTAASRSRIIVLDVATSHTVAAALENGELLGWFEYHTADLSCDMLDRMLPQLADGNLDHKRVLSEGGHGATVLRSFGFDTVEAVVATGPRRSLLEGSRLPIVWGAPLGDNMMTGTAGLLESVRRHRRGDR
jgi:uncharacterized protein (DUF1786 family)